MFANWGFVIGYWLSVIGYPLLVICYSLFPKFKTALISLTNNVWRLGLSVETPKLGVCTFHFFLVNFNF
jgi:hypothetical protein